MDLFDRIKEGVLSKTQSLNLKTDSDVALKIYRQIDIEHDQLNISLPCVILTTAGLTETMDEEASDTFRLGVRWPVGFAICDRQPKKTPSNEKRYLVWRRTIMENFRDQRLTNVPEVYRCTFNPQAIFNPSTPQFEFVQSSFILWFHSLEERYSNG